MMINEADSEQVLDIDEDGMQDSSDDEGREGDEESAPGTSEQQEDEVDDSVHCFTGHTGNLFAVLQSSDWWIRIWTIEAALVLHSMMWSGVGQRAAIKSICVGFNFCAKVDSCHFCCRASICCCMA